MAAPRRPRRVRDSLLLRSWEGLRAEALDRLDRANAGRAPDLAPAERDRLWRRGFLADKWLEYGLADHPLDDYVSDLQGLMTANMNGRYDIIVDDRLALQRVLRGRLRLPDVLLAVYDRHATPLPGWTELAGRPGAGSAIEIRAARATLDRAPIAATLRDGAVELPDGIMPADAFVAGLRAAGEDRLVLRAAARHGDLAALLPDAADGLRLLVLRRPMPVGPRAVAAILVAGCATFPIELASGRIGGGLSVAPCGASRPISAHPRTGAEIAGRAVPFWGETVKAAVTALIELPFLHQAAWAMTIDATGPLIVAGESCPALSPFQRHRPLLADPEARAFYEHFGILDFQGPPA